MNHNDRNRRSPSGPFGMGRQGYIIIAIVILATAIFASTRTDWISMLAGALILPLVVLAVIHVLSRLWRGGTRSRDSRRAPRQGVDLLTFLARTNPIMFLLVGGATRGVDDSQYQDLLRSGPYGMGWYGYVIVLAIVLGPLILALLIVAVTGQLPGHGGPHVP